MKYLNILIAVVLLGLFSCKSKDNSTSDNPDGDPKKKNASTIVEGKISDSYGSLTTGDRYTINAVRVDGNMMYVDLSYSGGCKEHVFAAYGSAAIAKSLPPIRQIKINHNGNQDHCRAMINQTVKIDLRNFTYKKEEGSQIYLNLEGYKERITYTYKK